MNERKSPFEIMTADLFKNADFVESAWIGGREIPCIASAVAEDPRFTEFGFDDGVKFFLRVPAGKVRECDDRYVTFHNRRYKITSRETDSTGNTVNLYLANPGGAG